MEISKKQEEDQGNAQSLICSSPRISAEMIDEAVLQW